MLKTEISAELALNEKTPLHSWLFNHTLFLTDMSRSHMNHFRSRWDQQHAAYKAFRRLDQADINAIEAGRPIKQAIPMAFAKVHTFKSFVLSLYFQREKFYELTSTGSEDEQYRELAEKLLQSDLEKNQWYHRVGQWATHMGKHGLGIIKHTWDEDYGYVARESMEGGFGLGKWKIGGKTVSTYEQVLKNAGNKLKVVNPNCFLPDPRVPLIDINDGEFCGDEFELSKTELLEMQHRGVVMGIDDLSPMTISRAHFRRRMNLHHQSQINHNDPTKTSHLVRITEMQIKLVPSKHEMFDGSKLGDEDFPVKYLVWIANDSRIIRLEPYGYLHDKFTYNISTYDEDDTDYLSVSLVDLVQQLQDTSDWFFNSRVESVSRNIEGKLVVDPMGVEVESIKNDSRLILVKKGASRLGVDNFVKQLDVRDTTAGHMNDVSAIAAMVNSVTAVNENAQGQYHTGRRSATEARVVTQGASARMKQVASSAWCTCFAPLGHSLLTNLRQGMNEEMIVLRAGEQWFDPEHPSRQEAVMRFLADPETLIRSQDFWVFEGTIASEKQYTAQQLMELFNTVVTLGPQGIIDLEISPKLLIHKIFELLGVPDLASFDIRKDPQTLQNAVQAIVMQVMQQQMAQQQQPQNVPQ